MNSYDLYKRASAETLRRRVQEHPNSASDRFFLALKLCDEQRFAEGIECFREVLRLEPNHRDAGFYCGKTLFEQGKYRDAEAMFLRHGEFDFLREQRMEYLAEIYRFTGRLILARDHFLSDTLSELRKRSHVAHCALNEMLLQGIQVGVAHPQLALVDERIAVSSEGRIAHCRLRIFRNQLQAGKVVILTSEAGMPAESTSAVNAAEWLVEHVLAESRYEVDPSASTWVTMYERGALGVPPMHIASLGFVLATVPRKKSGWALLDLLGLGRTTWVHEVRDLVFADISHTELEQMTDHRFYWP